MKKIFALIITVLLIATVVAVVSYPVFAETADTAAVEEAQSAADDAASGTSAKAVSAGILIAIAAAAGAIAMGFTISKALESIARQPEAGSNIRTSLMLGLVFIETLVIYALIVAILIIFVL